MGFFNMLRNCENNIKHNDKFKKIMQRILCIITYLSPISIGYITHLLSSLQVKHIAQRQFKALVVTLCIYYVLSCVLLNIKKTLGVTMSLEYPHSTRCLNPRYPLRCLNGRAMSLVLYISQSINKALFYPIVNFSILSHSNYFELSVYNDI